MYWFTVRANGKRMQVSTKTDNRKLAEKAYAKTVTDIQEGIWFEKQKAKTTTFAEMSEKYLSKYHRIRDEYSIKRLLPVFGHLTLAEITTELVSDYRDERLKKVKPATIYQELSLMRRMFNVARREWKWTKENPVADLSFAVGNKNARERWLTIEEERFLLEKATNPSWLRTLLVVALHTGMRRGEILNLMWKEVDFNRRLVTVLKSKNGEKRSIPMSQTLLGTLRGFGKVIDISGKVFPVSVRSLREAFDKTLGKVSLQDFHFHDLRHTFATRLVQNGVDLYKVKALLGHKTIAMTMRYAHHYPESLRSSVEVLDICYNFTTVKECRN
ncbi:MAG: tyrosine-type recombinase/integrase [Nitrospirae bacterium]|nr:tyrosine-type recombinase/integrase [Nitrospirota bacterium]